MRALLLAGLLCGFLHGKRAWAGTQCGLSRLSQGQVGPNSPGRGTGPSDGGKAAIGGRARRPPKPKTTGTTVDIQREQDILEHMLGSYDSRIRPEGLNNTWENTGGPVIVKINMLVRSISEIDDVNMVRIISRLGAGESEAIRFEEYSTQITFREEWVDRRLAYSRMNLQLPEGRDLPEFLVLPPKGEIWMPDSFFQNEKQARKHSIDKPNVLIRIYKDGGILYSVRISLVLSCPMNLRNYPFDMQICVLDVASYAYTSMDIKYIWKGGNPIQLKDAVRSSLPSFELENVNTSYCTSSTNTGEYSCLRTTLVLKRQLSYYLLQLYIPSSMLVIVSWVSFWLDRSAVPARVTLGVTTLLTMTTQSNGINAKLPPVSYTKAIDIWIGVCLALIFGALLEFACVTYVGDKDVLKRKKRDLAASKTKDASPKADLEEVKLGRSDAAVMLANLRTPKHTRPLASLDDEESAMLEKDPRYVFSIHHCERSEEDGSLACRCDRNPLLQPSRMNGPGQHSPIPTHMMALQYQHGIPVNQLAYPMYGMNGQQQPVYGLALERSKSRGQLVKHACRPFKYAVNIFLKEKDRSKKIDYCSRFCFPLIFICFNGYYWNTYMAITQPTPI